METYDNKEPKDNITLTEDYFKKDGYVYHFIGNKTILNGKDIYIPFRGSFRFPYLNLSGNLILPESINGSATILEVEGDIKCIALSEGIHSIKAKNLESHYTIKCGVLNIQGNVKCKQDIIASNWIIIGGDANIDWNIKAGSSIRIFGGVNVKDNIIAGENVIVEKGIKCNGIRTTGSITCRLELDCRENILAGASPGKVEPKDSIIACGKLINGKVLCGTLVEVGLPVENEIFEVYGVKYKVTRRADQGNGEPMNS